MKHRIPKLKEILAFSLFSLLFVLALSWAITDWNVPGNQHGAVVLAATSIIPGLKKNTRQRHLFSVIPAATPLLNVSVPFGKMDYTMFRLIARLTAQVDIAAGGGADGALVAEQPESLLRRFKLKAGSPNRTNVSELLEIDFPALRMLQTFMTGTAPKHAGLANAGIQAATLINSEVDVPFYIPRCVNPRIAALNVHELQSLDLTADFGDITGDLIIGGTRVLTLTNPKLDIDVEEFMDSGSNNTRYAVPMIRTKEIPNPGAQVGYPCDLKRGYPIRGILIKQFTRAAGVTAHTPVDTVINGIMVRINGATKIDYPNDGIPFSGWDKLQCENKKVYGLENVPIGYALVDFMPDGQLDRLISPVDYTSIELVFDIAALADSYIRIYPIEIIDLNQ